MSHIIPNTIQSEEVAQVVNEGGSLIVVCLESVVRNGTNLSGKWVFEIVRPDKKTRQLLIYKMKKEPETALTVNGVVSKIMSWGLPAAIFPFKKGQAFELFKDGSYRVDRRCDT
ncbi:hypothetical protein [Paracoccus sp. SM22M-07]|uniref:hypothetical protein n=1 Tax=Paracoccus sp. SM22M-07 TaxID=1520813 RepID=UPI001114AA50|nr:hypothetical protein [Paracoccus sp. SM22M-07]